MGAYLENLHGDEKFIIVAGERTHTFYFSGTQKGILKCGMVSIGSFIPGGKVRMFFDMFNPSWRGRARLAKASPIYQGSVMLAMLVNEEVLFTI